MNAQDFLANVSDPSQWLRKSTDLRASADRLWETFFEALVLSVRERHLQGRHRDEAKWEEATGYLNSAKLLYGLALETAFKAHILRTQPESIELRMSADGTGTVQQVEVKQFGTGMSSAHNLVVLAERAGLFRRGHGEIFPVDSDYRAVRELLQHLSDVVLWSGRYPVPIRSGDEWQPPKDVPLKAFFHYLRDWTDPILDHYQVPLLAADRKSFEGRMREILERHGLSPDVGPGA
jgi:hypothetical protein